MDANTMKAQLIARLNGTNYSTLGIDDREASDVLSRAELEFVMRRVVGDLNTKKKGFEFDKKRRVDLNNLLTSRVLLRRVGVGLNAGDFIKGTEDNGAMRTPDKDYQMESIRTNSEDSVESEFGIFCRIPDECLFIINESCNTSKGMQLKFDVPVDVVNYEDYNIKIRMPYNSPYYNLVWRMDSGNWTPADSTNFEISSKRLSGLNADGSGNTLEINTERSVHLIPGKDWTINGYKINYIKKPRRILVDTISPNNQVSSELGTAIHDEVIDIAVKLFVSDRMPEQVKYQAAEKEQREDE